MAVSINLQKLQSIVTKSKEESNNSSNNNVSTAYLPEGKHKVRFFVDPENELFREIKTHRSEGGSRILCPDFLRGNYTNNGIDLNTIPAFCEVCSISKELDNWKIGADRNWR